MHETRTLAQFVAQIQFADLPSSLIDGIRSASENQNHAAA